MKKINTIHLELKLTKLYLTFYLMYNYSFYIMFNFTKAKQEGEKKEEEVSPGLGKIKSFSHVFSNYYFWIIVIGGEEGIQNLVLFAKENNKCHYVIRLMVFYICVLFIY